MVFKDNVITVDTLCSEYPEIENVNYYRKIFVFDESYTQEELDKIYDLIVNKWKANHIYELDKVILKNGGYGTTYHYEDHHEIIERKMILIENCDLYDIVSSYDLYEWLTEEYETYFVASKDTLDKGRRKLCTD